MISKDKPILILSYDFRLNQTFVWRYLSFIKKLNKHGFTAKGIGFSFHYQPHPLSQTEKTQNPLENTKIIQVNYTNGIQKVLCFFDKYGAPFAVKKIFLAIHIIIYKVDQWYVEQKNLKALPKNPSIIISGGQGGIIKTAYLLAKKNNAKLILDYRDPWNFGYHLLETSPFIYRFKKRFTLKTETEILEYAHHITTVSESLKSFFPKKYHRKITVVENGSNFEQDEIIDLINPIPSIFNITYLGTIYNDQLDDESFFEAFKQFYHSKSEKDKNHIRLNFIGSDKNDKLKLLIKKYDLTIVTTITKRLNQEELLEYLVNASLFLQLRFKGRSKIITSKIADYLMFRKPILLPASDEGDIAETIRKYNAGYVCTNYKEVTSILENKFQRFLNKEDITLKQEDFSWLSRSEIANKLIDVIKKLEEN